MNQFFVFCVACCLLTSLASAGSLLRTPLPGGCTLEADVRRDAQPACLRLSCNRRSAQTLVCDATALHQIDQVIPSADGRWLAVLSVGEGHPWLEIVDLPALRRGDYRAACSINPYPGVMSLDAWLGGALRIGSDVDLRLDPGRRAAGAGGADGEFIWLLRAEGCGLSPG